MIINFKKCLCYKNWVMLTVWSLGFWVWVLCSLKYGIYSSLYLLENVVAYNYYKYFPGGTHTCWGYRIKVVWPLTKLLMKLILKCINLKIFTELIIVLVGIFLGWNFILCDRFRLLLWIKIPSYLTVFKLLFAELPYADCLSSQMDEYLWVKEIHLQ